MQDLVLSLAFRLPISLRIDPYTRFTPFVTLVYVTKTGLSVNILSGKMRFMTYTDEPIW